MDAQDNVGWLNNSAMKKDLTSKPIIDECQRLMRRGWKVEWAHRSTNKVADFMANMGHKLEEADKQEAMIKLGILLLAVKLKNKNRKNKIAREFDIFGKKLNPPFDPYASGLHFLIASYLVPYVGLTGYVGANAKLQGPDSRRLVAGLLGVESGQDAVIRALLYERALEVVHPYGITVAEFTNRISILRNKLGGEGVKDEGLLVPPADGAEGRISGNVLAGDPNSVAYDRTPEEILRIVYGSGSEKIPGGIYPNGGNGNIAKSHLPK
ncbi:hypothetical protein FNV43_RR01040 [Rhamnella rubrinervis]|uniref:Uncharacterized protein n=1 Tax=Rhamnella rubrinervis TaxID=2594499 RepID=A0A8K0HRI8_9ROSA|nr:hypothetical protein FNV43_RR01040 [Rhamnella rubrinervis]